MHYIKYNTTYLTYSITSNVHVVTFKTTFYLYIDTTYQQHYVNVG